ncbi:SDR family NAD(P)-dependent oxidoreductase [Yinghuangia aomiensis]
MSVFRDGILDGRVALVTGGATGLGLEIARTLGRHGAKVAICSRKEDNLRPAVDELVSQGIEARYGVCDVRDMAVRWSASSPRRWRRTGGSTWW